MVNFIRVKYSSSFKNDSCAVFQKSSLVGIKFIADVNEKDEQDTQLIGAKINLFTSVDEKISLYAHLKASGSKEKISKIVDACNNFCTEILPQVFFANNDFVLDQEILEDELRKIVMSFEDN